METYITKNSTKTVQGIVSRTIMAVIAFAMLFASQANAATELYFIHNDHLGTPQVVTDKNQVVVWEGKQKPFGEVDVTTNTLDGDSRFPGQYLDKESGLHYNYFRDYDPTIGRYIQSDPIGILRDFNNPQLQVALENNLVVGTYKSGGLNYLYEYAGANPMSLIDPSGLIVCWPWGCKGEHNLPPTEQPKNKPEDPEKPKNLPSCADSTKDLNSCIACCSRVAGIARSGGSPGICHEQCYRKQGITLLTPTQGGASCPSPEINTIGNNG